MAFSGVPLPPSSHSIVDVDVTIVSAKHLKNVNWRRGDLKPYAVVYLAGFDADDHRRLVTKPDDAGSTRPVWNERFTLPVPSTLLDNCTLAVDVFHSKPSETPKPLVGTARCSLRDLIGSPYPVTPIRTLELRRPSGRPQGKIRIKVSTLERVPLPPPSPLPPEPAPPTPPPTSFLHTHPPPSWCYNPNALPPQPSPSVTFSCSSPRSTMSYPPPHPPVYSIPTQRLPPYQYQYGAYLSDPHFGCCPFGGYHVPAVSMAAPLPWPLGSGGSVGGPSAPVDDQSSSRQHQRRRDGGSNTEGSVTGLAVGAVAGTLGGMALDEEEVKRERELFRRDYRGFRDEYQ